ncbi:MAG TPA: hypothetical protein VIJ47_14875 [Acidimicrobiales bacterium]
MSLWTPGGEVPVERNRGAQPRSAAPQPGAPAISEAALAEAAAAAGIDLDELSAEERAQLEAMMVEMAQVQAQLASAPAAQVIANHLGGFYELARIHLSQDPPRFEEASLAIDAMAGVLDAVEDRMGQDGPSLREGLNQLQMAFIQMRRDAIGDDASEAEA